MVERALPLDETLHEISVDVGRVPLRFPAAWPPTPLGIGTQLFAHLFLVALPTVLITRHFLRASA